MIRVVPLQTTGTIGTPRWIAATKAPLRKGSSSPSAAARALGEDHQRAAVERHPLQALDRRQRIVAVDGDHAHRPQHRAEHRLGEHLALGARSG